MSHVPQFQKFGKTLRALRLRSGHGARALARQAGVSHVTLLNIENGKRNATLKTVLSLTGSLGLPADELRATVSGYLGTPANRRFEHNLIGFALDRAGLAVRHPEQKSKFDLIVDCAGVFKFGIIVKAIQQK